MSAVTSMTVSLQVHYKLPPLPVSSWDGDGNYTWTGEPFEYTKSDMREYGRSCFEAGRQLGLSQGKKVPTKAVSKRPATAGKKTR